MSGRAPTIIGGKGNVATAAAKAFVDLKVDVGVQKLVIQSQSRIIFELVQQLGGEARIDRASSLEEGWELVTSDDPATNELVLTAQKSVDFNANEANSPKI